MTRVDLVQYMLVTFAELSDETGVALIDTREGMKNQIDAAWAALGDDTGNMAAAQALVEYHCLRRFRMAVAVRTDANTMTNMRRNRSQIFEQLDRLVEDAAERAAAAGHPVTPTPAYSLVSLTTDWVESE